MTSLHVRVAAILAGTCPACEGAGTEYRWDHPVNCDTCDGTGKRDLPHDIRDVIEELAETLADVEYRNDKQATELRIAWRAMDNMRLAAVPAPPSTDSEAGQ